MTFTSWKTVSPEGRRATEVDYEGGNEIDELPVKAGLDVEGLRV